MKFSVWPNSAHPWAETRDFATFVEAEGWDGLWYADHYMPNTGTTDRADGPMNECFSVLAALAAVTSRMRLGSLVTPTTVNHPALIANRSATIDNISGGRFVLGMGAGWQINEHDAFGIELFGAKDRVDRFEEAIRIVSSMLSEQRTTLKGKHFVVTDAPCDPKPVQSPLPILVGTGGPRMLRLTARHAQEWNTWGTPHTTKAVMKRLLEACEKEGRDPATVRKSVQALFYIAPDAATADKIREKAPADRAVVGTIEQLNEAVAEFAAIGFDEVCVPDFTLGPTPQARRESYSAFMSGVVGNFR